MMPPRAEAPSLAERGSHAHGHRHRHGQRQRMPDAERQPEPARVRRRCPLLPSLLTLPPPLLALVLVLVLLQGLDPARAQMTSLDSGGTPLGPRLALLEDGGELASAAASEGQGHGLALAMAQQAGGGGILAAQTHLGSDGPPGFEPALGDLHGAASMAVPLRLAGGGFSAASRLFQCAASFQEYKAREAAAAKLPESQKLSELPAGSKHIWPEVNVSTVGGPSDFGWLESAGTGLFQTQVNTRTCVYLSARTHGGLPFDRGSRQRAFFSAVLRSGKFVLAPDVTYLPERSMHLLCYSPPTTGQFLLSIRLVFTNCFDLTTCFNLANSEGFARYHSVLTTWVRVTSAGQYNLTEYRSALPLCTPDLLTQTANRGFWNGDTWHPEACRLTRLSQRKLLLCLNGKRVLMAGDSQMRISFALLQIYLNYSSREEFLDAYRGRFVLGEFFDKLKLNPNTTGPGNSGPPVDASGAALVTQYQALGGETTYYGGVYQGFTVRSVRTRVELQPGITIPVAFNLTFSSQFTIGQPLFDDWKLNGSLTGGVKVTDGGVPFDLVAMANQIHDSSNFEAAAQYLTVLESRFLPELAPLLASANSFAMFGGLSAFEARKTLFSLYKTNNPRLHALEVATRKFLPSAGFPNFFELAPLTSPRPDLAFDATHYTWPVTLAMLDLWLGSACPDAGEAT